MNVLSQPSWLSSIHEGPSQGKFQIDSKPEASLTIEWKKANILSADLADFKKKVSNLASPILATAELKFLQKYPHAVSKEYFLMACAPFFEKGVENVDWTKVNETIQSSIEQFYLADISSFGEKALQHLLQDAYYFASVRKTDSDQILGFTMFSVTPALSYGQVKVISLIVPDDQKHRDLEKLLLSSIFKIIPLATNLFIFARPTNDLDIKSYRSLGFEVNQSPIQDPHHKVNLEHLVRLDYLANQATVLQETAKGLE